MDRAFMQYVLNAAWQLPVLAAGAWLLVRVARPAAVGQHRIWTAVLALAVSLPLFGVLPHARASFAGARGDGTPAASSSAQASTAGAAVQTLATQAPTRNPTHAPRPDWLTKTQTAFASLHFTREIEISPRTAEWVTSIFLIVLFMGLMRIALAWSGAQRFARASRDAELTHPERALVAACARRMSIKEPEIRVLDNDTLAGPVVVGAARPTLLSPAGFLRGLLDSGREDEAIAALCHEMAHIRRHDYAVNLLCEVMAAPLKWHPVTYGVERQIHRTREMACDAAAALAMNSQMEYARCLVGLAERIAAGQIVHQPGVIGLFNGNALEERVMQLINKQTRMNVPAKIARSLVGVAAMAAALALVTMVHVVPARAQAPGTVAKISQAAPPAPALTATPAAVAAPNPVVAAPAKPAPVVLPPVQPQPLAEPQAVPAPGNAKIHRNEVIMSRHGKLYAWIDGHRRELTPAERARVERQLREAQKKIAAAEARIHSRQFRMQIAQARRAAQQVDLAKIQKQLEESQKKMQQQVAEAQKQLNSARMQQQMAEAQMQLNSARMQQQMAEAQKQLSEAMARLNSRQFKEQMQQAVRAAQQVDTAKIQKQIDEAQKQLQKQLNEMKKQQLESSQPGTSHP